MNKMHTAATLIATLLLATSATVCAADTAQIKTLPAVEVRPDVAWVGHPQNERIVTLATVHVRPDALGLLQAATLDAMALLPQVEPIQLPALPIELPTLRPLGLGLNASVRGP